MGFNPLLEIVHYRVALFLATGFRRQLPFYRVGQKLISGLDLFEVEIYRIALFDTASFRPKKFRPGTSLVQVEQ